MTNLSSTKDGAIPSRSLALLQALCFLSLAQWDNLFPSPALTSTTPSLTGTSHLLPSFPDPKTQHHIRAPPCRLGACPAAAHYDTCPKHWHWAALFEMVSEGLKKKKNSWMWVKSMKKRCEKKLACLDLCAPGHLCLKLFLIALITVQKMPLSCCLCSQLSNSTCQVMGSTGKMLSCVQKGTNRNMWQGLLEWKQAAEDNPGDEANRPTNLELQERNLGRMTAALWEQAASCCPSAAFGWLEKVQARGAEDVRLSGCCLLGQWSESSVQEKAVLCLEWCVPRVCTQQWVP